MADEPSYRTERWAKHFDEIDREIAQLAVLLDVPILNPGVIERVLQNDASVCAKPKPQSFAKLRGLLMMHYSVRDRAVVQLGIEETQRMILEIAERLRARIGDQLGNMPAPGA
jgi:hypothetical protein